MGTTKKIFLCTLKKIPQYEESCSIISTFEEKLGESKLAVIFNFSNVISYI